MTASPETSSEAARKADQPSVAAILVAAGPGTRMRGTEKLEAPLLGRPLLGWTVAAFEETPEVDEIVLVVARDRLTATKRLAESEGWRRVRAIVPGGARRRDSVRAGLDALSEGTRVVVVHDGSRPLVTPVLIREGLAAGARGNAAIASEPVKETIKRVERGMVVETLPRAELVRTQTPQVFDRESLVAAHAQLPEYDAPDDAALFVALGLPLVTYHGGHENLAVTTPDDLPVVEALLRRRQVTAE